MTELSILGIALIWMLPKLADKVMPYLPATILAVGTVRRNAFLK